MHRCYVPSIISVFIYLFRTVCHQANATSVPTSSALKNDSLQKFLDSDEYRNRYSDVPSLFSNANDEKYNKYAACLAAMEGIRRIRDLEITSIRRRRSSKNCIRDNREEKRIQSQFIKNSKQIMDLHSLSPKQFTSLSKKLMYDEALKQKVIILSRNCYFSCGSYMNTMITLVR
jgi:Domain of unknown function (DUF4168)